MKLQKFKTIGLGCLLLVCASFLSACRVGTSDLFVHPSEQGYEYEVAYDCLGGHINTVEVRAVFYAEDALLWEPQGTKGMLVAPRNGAKTLLGWYTKYTEEEVNGVTVRTFDEEDRWDFATDRVSAAVAPDKKLTLYARWAENPNICFIDAADPAAGSYLTWNMNVGSSIQRPTSTEPRKAGYTLLDYYTDETCTEKYTFDVPITEEMIGLDEAGNSVIYIYCSFIEGEYTRIKTVGQLQAIAENPTGTYVLANDLSLTGTSFTPIVEFSGVLYGNGHTLTGLTINALYKVAGVAALRAEEAGFGLFSALKGATVTDLTLKDVQITVDTGSNVGVCLGALAGKAENAVVKNCVIDGAVFTAAGASINITANPLMVASESAPSQLESCTLTGIETDGLSTSGTLIIQE